MRYFNTEAQCVPDEHYMVRLDDRLAEIKERYVDRGKYFVINCGRQYGKTTTLYALAEYLQDEYAVFFMDFQGMTEMEYRNGETLSVAVARQLINAAGNAGMDGACPALCKAGRGTFYDGAVCADQPDVCRCAKACCADY